MNSHNSDPATLIPALRHLVRLLVMKDYGRLEDEGLIRQLMLKWCPRTSPQEIEDTLMAYGHYIATKQGPTWEEIDTILAERGVYQPNTSDVTLVDAPDDAFAQAWTAADVADTTRLVPIDLHTTTNLPKHVAFDLWTAEEGQSDLNAHVLLSDDLERPVQLAYLQAFPLALVPPLQDLIHTLVIGDYEGLVARGLVADARRSAADIEAALTEYWDTQLADIEDWAEDPSRILAPPYLIDKPVHGFRYAAAFPAPGMTEPLWNVETSLWWSEDSFPADLKLKARIQASTNGLVALFDHVDW